MVESRSSRTPWTRIGFSRTLPGPRSEKPGPRAIRSPKTPATHPQTTQIPTRIITSAHLHVSKSPQRLQRLTPGVPGYGGQSFHRWRRKKQGFPFLIALISLSSWRLKSRQWRNSSQTSAKNLFTSAHLTHERDEHRRQCDQTEDLPEVGPCHRAPFCFRLLRRCSSSRRA